MILREVKGVYQKFECLQELCRHSCCHFWPKIIITTKELEKISEQSGLPCNQIAELQKLDSEKYSIVLKVRNGSCIFLEPPIHGRCTIYKNRPGSCIVSPYMVLPKKFVNKIGKIKYETVANSKLSELGLYVELAGTADDKDNRVSIRGGYPCPGIGVGKKMSDKEISKKLLLAKKQSGVLAKEKIDSLEKLNAVKKRYGLDIMPKH